MQISQPEYAWINTGTFLHLKKALDNIVSSFLKP